MTSNLRRLSRLIWFLIGGGGVLFIVCVWFLSYTHPGTPANQLVNRHTFWILIPSIVMAMAGMYVSLRYWRCPYCGKPLRTRFPIPRDCPRCGRDVGLYD
jgi:hypothetical protein